MLSKPQTSLTLTSNKHTTPTSLSVSVVLSALVLCETPRLILPYVRLYLVFESFQSHILTN